MRKSLVIALSSTMFTISVPAFAEEVIEHPAEKATLRYGLRTQAEATWGRETIGSIAYTGSEPKAGGGVGGFMEYDFGGAFTLIPSVILVQESFNLKPTSAQTTSTYLALRVGAALGYRVGAWFRPEVGVTVSEGFGDVKTENKISNSVSTSSSRSFSDSGLSSTWVNGHVAAGFPIQFATWTMTPALGYEIGLTNRSKVNNIKITTDSVIVRVDFTLW